MNPEFFVVVDVWMCVCVCRGVCACAKAGVRLSLSSTHSVLLSYGFLYLILSPWYLVLSLWCATFLFHSVTLPLCSTPLSTFTCTHTYLHTQAPSRPKHRYQYELDYRYDLFKSILRTTGENTLTIQIRRLLPAEQNSYFSSLFSHWVVSDSLWPRGLQHNRLPCLSLSPRVC